MAPFSDGTPPKVFGGRDVFHLRGNVAVHIGEFCRSLRGRQRPRCGGTAPGGPVGADVELIVSDGAVGPPVLPGDIAKTIDPIRGAEIEHQRMRQGAVCSDHSVCQKVVGSPSRTFVAAPFSPTCSWLSTDTTRICCWGMGLLVGGEVPAVPKTWSSAALVQGRPLTSDKATRRTKRPVLAGKRTVFSGAVGRPALAGQELVLPARPASLAGRAGRTDPGVSLSHRPWRPDDS